MARLDAAADGRLLRACWNAREEERHPVHPQAAQSLSFDERANPAARGLILAHWDELRVAAGQLRRNGDPVPLNPPGPVAQLRAKCFSPSPLVTLDPQEVKLLGRLVFRLLDARPD